ncbi:GIY-YIG nuclease family protein [Diplocloster hominis]|uniref:GIY-YIG nuclease family protein n=1 Tax=Diplocloster hominis TaxID=3079010 RepID=UPI0031BA9854
MDKSRKKELQMEYKLRKPDMGVFVISCSGNGKQYVGYAQDLRGKMNGHYFKVSSGFHPNRRMLADWKEYGEPAFEMKVLEQLPYDEKEENKTDYTKELQELQLKWMSKLENAEEL